MGSSLNPTFFVEYNIGTGKKYPTQPGQNAAPGSSEESKHNITDANEVRLLLGQEIRKHIEFASNIFFSQDLWADREREIGFSTATSFG